MRLCSILRFLTFGVLILAPGVARSAAEQIEASERALVIHGATGGEYFGRPILALDLDGDGADDLVVGADRWSFDGGARPTLYVFRGGRSLLARGEIALATEAADVIILGDTGSDNLASSLAAGDVNGDGFQDLIATDSTLTVSGRARAGAAFVLFGDGDFFSQTIYDLALSDWDLKILGAAAGDDLGGDNLLGGMLSTGAASGDVNGDGVDDIALGAHLADANGRSDSGKVYLLFGDSGFASGTTLDLASQADVTILANETINEFGSALAIGDINADGIADLLAGYHYGSSGTFTSEGRVYAFYGRSSFPLTINLASVNPDVRILGASPNDELGRRVAVSDVNGDGVLDLIATADGWNAGAGAVYGFFGRSGFPSLISLSSQSPDFLVQGQDVGNAIGSTLIAGDFNGDGVGDFMFSSRDGERPGFNAEGRTFVLFGRRSGLPSVFQVSGDEADVIINGGVDGYQLGDWLGAGDLDGDGADEILIAAPFVDSSRGRLLLFDLTTVTAVDSCWTSYR